MTFVTHGGLAHVVGVIVLGKPKQYRYRPLMTVIHGFRSRVPHTHHVPVGANVD